MEMDMIDLELSAHLERAERERQERGIKAMQEATNKA